MIDRASVDRVKNSSFRSNEKYLVFECFLDKSGFAILSKSQRSNGIRDYLISRDDRKLIIHLIMKNISGSGWSWRPDIRRVQIRKFNLKDLPTNKQNEIFLLGGICTVDGDPLMCVWNIFEYMTQRTVRSCYVDVSTLIDAHNIGYLSKVVSDHRVYISNITSLGKLITEFIKRNSLSIFCDLSTIYE